MARVSSQKTRQAVLVTGDPLDPNTLPEKLQLFNELGEPLMMGGGYARYTEDQTTPSIASSIVDTDEIDLYASVRIFKISTNRPARVRMYPTETQRNADLIRGLGVKPTGNHGRLLEIATTSTMLELTLSPVVDITSDDPESPTFYTSITNLDTVTGPVVVTYHYFRTE